MHSKKNTFFRRYFIDIVFSLTSP